MNILQKIFALFGAQYIMIITDDGSYVRRVKRLAPGVWINVTSECRLNTHGGYPGRLGAVWKPLTKKVQEFYMSGDSVV